MKKIMLFILPILFVNCHYTEKYENREEDIIAAEKVTSELFELLKDSDYENAIKLFDKKFFEVTSSDELNQIFDATNRKLGKLKSTELSDYKTMVAEGAIDTGTYLLKYNCEFEKEKAELNITLGKSEDHKIRILGYSVSSKAFLK